MRMLGSIVAALALPQPIASHSVAPPPARPFSIPFELYKGHIFISAWVNGRGPYRFGFDTGASGIGRADAALTAELGLPGAGTVANSDGVTSTQSDLVAVRSLRVGDIERTGIALPSRDYNKGRKPGEQPMMGIIGRDFFGDRVVTVDYPARTITFGGKALRRGGRGVVAYGDGFAIPLCFASGCYPGKVDTGSSRGLVIPKDVVARISAGAPTLVGQAARTNGAATLYAVPLREPVGMGKASFAVATALYAEPSTDAINVGSDFLKDYVLTIDPQRHLLRIGAPARE